MKQAHQISLQALVVKYGKYLQQQRLEMSMATHVFIMILISIFPRYFVNKQLFDILKHICV